MPDLRVRNFEFSKPLILRQNCECRKKYTHTHTHTHTHKHLIRQETKKSNHFTGLHRPTGLQEVEAPRIQDNRHTEVVRLSAPRTGRIYPTRNIHYTHFC